MSEQVLVSPIPRRTSIGGYLAGRGGRKEYWTVVGGLIGLGAILGMLGINLGAGVSAPSLVFMIRRLHDIGKSGWWSLAITFGPVVPMLVLLPFAPLPVLIVLVVLLSLVWTIWLGAIPGDPHENRFGPPPGRPDLAETFD